MYNNKTIRFAFLNETLENLSDYSVLLSPIHFPFFLLGSLARIPFSNPLTSSSRSNGHLVLFSFTAGTTTASANASCTTFPLNGLPPSPLPLHQHGQKRPEIEFGPEAFQKDNLRVLVTLPEHEITQPLDAGSPDQEIQAREAGGERVVVKDVGGDAFGVEIRRRWAFMI